MSLGSTPGKLKQDIDMESYLDSIPVVNSMFKKPQKSNNPLTRNCKLNNS